MRKFVVALLVLVVMSGAAMAAEGLTFPTGHRPSPVDLSHLAKNPPKTVRTAGALPVSYDLRDHIQMPPVKKQSPFGTCWAHAVMAALETNAIKQGILTSSDLSEFHLAWFTYADKRPGKSFTITDVSDEFGDKPFDPILDQGGEDMQALALLTRSAGPTDEVYAPYPTSYDREPLPGVPEDTSLYPRKLSIKDARFIYAPDYDLESREQLKRLILEDGAVHVSYHCDVNYQKNQSQDQSAYYSEEIGINHGVAVIGWDDSIPKESFNPDKPSIDGAWIVRNSWGEDWGNMGGYFYMSYEQDIDLACSYVVERADSAVNAYGHDDLGWCNTMSTLDDEDWPRTTVWAANVFKAKNNEMLKQVAFYTADNNTDYELCVYALGDSVPRSPIGGTLLTSQSGTLPYCGYHKIDIKTDTPLTGGHYFSVAVRIDNPNGAVFPMETARPDYSDGAVVNEGESYFSEDGKKWDDSYFDGPSGNACNVCIKAFTVNGGSGSTDGRLVSVLPRPVEMTDAKKEEVRSAIEDLDLPGVDISDVEVFALSGDKVDVGTLRSPYSLTEEQKKTVSGEGRVLAAVLPKMTAREAGIFCFAVSFDESVPVEATLEWHSFPQSEADSVSVEPASARLAGDRTAVFMKNGRTITTVPADHEVEVAAYFEKGVTYAPVIAVVTASGDGENDENNEDNKDNKDGKNSPTPTNSKGSGGGCSAGFGTLAAAAVLFGAASFVRKRR